MGTFTALINQLDPDDETHKGDQFEHVSKWFLQNDPVYSRELKKVWLWKEWPYQSPTGAKWRWKEEECGIDLVAETHDGKLWAIQAKAYAENHWISKEEINKWLAESSPSKGVFSYRLLIARTNHLGPRALDVMVDPTVGRVLRDRLEDADVSWPASLSDLLENVGLRAPKLPPKEPTGHWAYEAEARDAVVDGFLNGADRGQMLMFCGLGKTLTANYIREVEKLAAQRTLVAVPSLALARQMMREFRANQKVDFRALPVCSDESVRRDEMGTLGLPNVTNPQEINEELRKDGPIVVFSTYHSTPQIAAAFKLGNVPEFDLIIADEAHHTVGRVGRAFSTVLDNEKIPARFRLFMTATPTTFTARVKNAKKISASGEEVDFEVASMDDGKKYGKQFYSLSFREAVDRGLVTDIRLMVIEVDKATDPVYLETYPRWAQNRRYVRLPDDEKRRLASDLAIQVALISAMRDGELHLGILYTNTILRSKKLTVAQREGADQPFGGGLAEVNGWMPEDVRFPGYVWSTYVDGTMSTKEREERINDLVALDKDTPGVVANARCLGEGIDIPSVDFIAIIDPRRSVREITQATGRAVRLAPGKEIATVVVPLVVDTSQDIESAFNTSAFSGIRNTLLALRSVDEVLAEQIDTICREDGPLDEGEQGTHKKPLKFVWRGLADEVPTSFARAMRLKIVEMVPPTSFEEYYGALDEFYQKHGYSNVPIRHVTADGVRLGGWINKLRLHYFEGTLVQDRVAKLEKFPDWEWNVNDAQWQENFRLYREYVEKTGDVIVRISAKIGDFEVGIWAKKQRQLCAAANLDEDRRELLDSVDFVWNLRDADWKKGYRHLKEYVDQNKDALVGSHYKTNGYLLGRWVMHQRDIRDKLSNDQVELLDAVGFVWDLKEARSQAKEPQWQERFKALARWADQNGHAQPAQTVKFEGHKIGFFVSDQRALWRRGTISATHKAQLETLPDWSWEPGPNRPRSGRRPRLEARWQEDLGKSRRYVDQTGTVRPISSVFEDFKVGEWINTQRKLLRAGKLNSDHEKQLDEAVPGWRK